MTPRNDALRKRLRAQYARLKLPCGICEQPIDFSTPHPHPMSAAVDHVIPLDKGGPDTAENSQPSHRACNRFKWNKLPHELVLDGPRTFVTHRVW